MDELATKMPRGARAPDDVLMPPPPPRFHPGPGVAPQADQRTAAPWALRMPAPRRRQESPAEVCTTSIETEDFDFSKVVSGDGFVVPTKRILSEGDVSTFLGSSTCRDYVSFINFLCSKVVGVKITDMKETPESLRPVVEALSTLSRYVDEVPPQEHTLRYGNPAFRDWHDLVSENSERLVSAVLPDHLKASAKELAYYFGDSFGNRTRIDYGTGHETNFLVFLYCLAKLGVVKEGDSAALVLTVFNAYLGVMRKIQQTYGLEPAGSRGCWGLDDYQILPFVFGSAQLINHKLIKPKSIHNSDFVQAFSKDFLYFGCVEYVLRVKRGGIRETSPMLNDISAVPRWQKVNNGMLKMYEGEVLSKFPIMQHLGFGTLFKWEEPQPRGPPL